MAQMIDVVAFSHYVDDPATFTEKLPVGTILTLVLEPENYHNPEAIAVYNEENQIGYITDGDINIAMDELFKGKDNVKSVLVRYDGIHTQKALSLDVSQEIKVTPYRDAVETDPFGGASPISFSKAPLILKEERQIIYWANQIDIYSLELIKRLPTDNIAVELESEMTALLDKYIPLADFSLSAECFSTITNVYHRLVNLMMIPEYKELYEDKLQQISKKREHFIHREGLDKIFKNQLTLLTERLEEKGFFTDFAIAEFEDPECPDDHEIVDLTKDIKQWMRLIPLKAASFRVKNPKKFAESLYQASLNYMDLYMVYTNIILLGNMKELFAKWVDIGKTPPKEEMHRRVGKVLSRIQELILEE